MPRPPLPLPFAPPKLSEEPLASVFVRGFVTAGLLGVLASGTSKRRTNRKELAVRTTQAAGALVAGVAAARALEKKEWGKALVGAGVGALSLLALESLLDEPDGAAARDSEPHRVSAKDSLEPK